MKKVKMKRYKLVAIILLIVTIICIILGINIYNDKIYPYVIEESRVKANAKITNVINEISLKIFREKYKYDDFVTINKNDKINIINTNTSALSSILSELTIMCNEELNEVEDITIKVPITWLGNTSFLYDKGPEINVKISLIGSVNCNYNSKFESAGINQTRHKIYLIINSKVKIMAPLNSEVIDIKCEIPVTETIIIGEIPSTAIDFSNK